MPRSYLHVKAFLVRTTRGNCREIEWDVAISWQLRGLCDCPQSLRYVAVTGSTCCPQSLRYVAVTGSTWLSTESTLCGCYGVYVTVHRVYAMWLLRGLRDCPQSLRYVDVTGSLSSFFFAKVALRDALHVCVTATSYILLGCDVRYTADNFDPLFRSNTLKLYQNYEELQRYSFQFQLSVRFVLFHHGNSCQPEAVLQWI